MKLFVVESPNKIKLITNILKDLKLKDFKIIATYGHLRTLDNFLIDENGNFKISWKKNQQLDKFLKYFDNFDLEKDSIFILTDPDREGEAIAQSILDNLDKNIEYFRLKTNEITNFGIQKALNNCTKINENLFNAYLCRVITDKFIGYEISPILWKKLIGCKSAGRVQSVALRILYNRENEIKNYIESETFNITFKYKDLIFTSYSTFKSIEETLNFIEEIKKCKLKIILERSQRVEHPGFPFNTASLQIYANKLGLTTNNIMNICQKLYEGIDIKDNNIYVKKSLITYHRTDSNYINPKFADEIKNHLKNRFSIDILNDKKISIRNKNIFKQEAHEAIRPTYMCYDPIYIKKCINNKFFKVYEAIFNRTIAFYAKDAIYDVYKINLINEKNENIFYNKSENIISPGFKIIFKKDKIETNNNIIHIINNIKNDIYIDLNICNLEINKILSNPPHRITESELVKTLYSYGIGRPSTYGYIIDILKKREYAFSIKNVFYIKNVGIILIKFLHLFIKDIIDFKFTKNLENSLEEIVKSSTNINKNLLKIKNLINKFINDVKDISKIDVLTKIENDFEIRTCKICKQKLYLRYIKRIKDFKFMCLNYPKCTTFIDLLSK